MEIFPHCIFIKNGFNDMKKWLISIFSVALLGACASSTPPYQPMMQSAQSGGNPSIRSEIESNRKLLVEKRQRLENARLQNEIDELRDEIKELESKLAALEQRDREQAQQTRGTTATPPSGVNVGPRGGCYTYSKSGKKRYVKC